MKFWVVNVEWKWRVALVSLSSLLRWIVPIISLYFYDHQRWLIVFVINMIDWPSMRVSNCGFWMCNESAGWCPPPSRWWNEKNSDDRCRSFRFQSIFLPFFRFFFVLLFFGFGFRFKLKKATPRRPSSRSRWRRPTFSNTASSVRNIRCCCGSSSRYRILFFLACHLVFFSFFFFFGNHNSLLGGPCSLLKCKERPRNAFVAGCQSTKKKNNNNKAKPSGIYCPALGGDTYQPDLLKIKRANERGRERESNKNKTNESKKNRIVIR